MHMSPFSFSTVDWKLIEKTEHPGITGKAYWQTQTFGEEGSLIRVRMVEYTPGYLADHWCKKGHVLLCLDGELETELEDGTVVTLTPGTSYQVGDNAEAHRSRTETGARLFIVD
ncbi:DHCW motif cupin fold protein [Leminorella grimontii]|uniref:DHCW motif cupin fold protein n=1 Tax=Leminorella grimontii TaxID=82981 RepID=UPI00208283D5|nr:DHCW motif cupin fold protein [Leminorella grimontii]GKX58784.1 hypothetical protein SOASR031_10990 [Leminorella grimontii]